MLNLANFKKKKKVVNTNYSCTKNQLDTERILNLTFKPMVGYTLHLRLPPK